MQRQAQGECGGGGGDRQQQPGLGRVAPQVAGGQTADEQDAAHVSAIQPGEGPEAAGLCAIALLMGAGFGLGAVAFRCLICFFTWRRLGTPWQLDP